jgi:predicted metal-dependent hydrolase
MNIAGIDIELVQKDIKNIHLAVYPPDGRVRLAAPKDVNEKTLELYVASKLAWIKRQQRKFAKVERQSEREYVSRETHYIYGKRYILKVHKHSTKHKRNSKVLFTSMNTIDMYVNVDTSKEQRAVILKRWHKSTLIWALADLIPKWEKILDVNVNKVRVQQLKTKWGSCNPDTRNLMFNLELIKKSKECIEYVVLHELLHLKERTHNERFKSYLDRYMPRWQHIRDELNS